LRAEDQFHVGIVVENLAAAQAELSAVFGYTWCAEVGGPIQVRLPSGDAEVDIRCAYSVTSPRLEVIGQVPGTLWEPAVGSGVHHVGYWSDDVAADCAELERHGYLAEATREGPDGVLFFAFYRGPAGVRVELLNRGAQPALEEYWAAGAGA
jgi:catechol 2,3-dioxygenase-like lactoylglutathione lyase family enzyme